jgi:hypothetical protein
LQFRATIVAAAFAFIMIALPPVAAAQSLFDRLVMPGPLIEGHAKYQKKCKSCHVPFSKSSQTKLCMDCHKDVASDRKQKRGLHGLRPDAVKAECKHCHTDHKGKNADVVQFDKETFTHKFTDFDLKGAHKSLSCESCHTPKEKYRKAPSQCVACHEKNDQHKGELGKKCAECHNETSWRQVKTYDHGKTKFPLKGAHKKVACKACHAGERYKGVTTVCANCHQLQDVHRGRYGKKCETCHSSEKWNIIRFDHDKQTKFQLRGKHAQAKCDSCHSDDHYKDKLAVTCVSCHKKHEPHKGKLGDKCETCHDENGWRMRVAFDHDFTQFPLLGLHAVVPCEECHRTKSFADTSSKCEACHKDTSHEGRLGADCSLCHNPNGWKFWKFDHDKQTMYPLTGAHKGLHCHLCHREKNVKKVSQYSSCYACHAADDTHQGNFGTACEKCHTTKTFRPGGLRR